MPGGQPQVLSTRFKGLNRLMASYMLDASESPDTADAAQYNDVSQVLGPRRGRKPIQALSFPIRGVVPLNLSWLKLQLIATGDGSITPYTLNDPTYFVDVGSYLGYSLNGRYVTDGGGPYNVDGSGNAQAPVGADGSYGTYSGTMAALVLQADLSTSNGFNLGIRPVFSNAGGSIQFTVRNTGSLRCFAGVYRGALIAASPVAGTNGNYNSGASGSGTDSPSAGANLYTLTITGATVGAPAPGPIQVEFDMIYTP